MVEKTQVKKVDEGRDSLPEKRDLGGVGGKTPQLKKKRTVIVKLYRSSSYSFNNETRWFVEYKDKRYTLDEAEEVGLIEFVRRETVSETLSSRAYYLYYRVLNKDIMFVRQVLAHPNQKVEVKFEPHELRKGE